VPRAFPPAVPQPFAAASVEVPFSLRGAPLFRIFPILLLVSAVWLLATTVGAGPEIFGIDAEAVPRERIDELVFARLAAEGIPVASPCTDAVFVRRVFLDVIGTLPTAGEARAFLDDPAPGKRAALIEHLLAREEFADYWAMKWCDVLRVKAEFPVNLWPNAVQAYHRWLRDSIRDEMPYDRFARELLTSSGSNFRVPQVNFYRATQSREPVALAGIAALTFMGERIDGWPEDRRAGMAAFFSRVAYKATGEWKEEIVLFDPDPGAEAVLYGVLPDGARVALEPGQDPRQVYADWLVTPANPWFTRAIANRVWCWLLGRGIIHEPDDIRADNPPSNPELLEYLVEELIAAEYDLKHLFRIVLNAQTYQLSPVPASAHPQAAALFAHYPTRRLDAEVLIDALNAITGTKESYMSPIPEPFTFIPGDTRAVALADGNITSSFLEMFGRPSRDTGLYAERSNQSTATQRLHLLNSSHIRRKIEGPAMRGLFNRARTPDEATTQLYLTIISRPPTEQERRTARRYAAQGGLSRREAFFDLAWALINSPEFLLHH